MKYIKNIESFDSLNEEIDLKKVIKDYKYLLIGIGLYAGICNYTNMKATMGYELSHEEISRIVNDVEYVPSGENKVLVDTIKLNLIDYVKNSDKIEPVRKDMVISAIKDLKISVVPNRFADAIGRANTIGVHFLYVDYPTGQIKNAIVLNGEKFNDGIFTDSDNKLKRTTLIHELFHFIDFKLNKDKGYGYSSDAIDLSLLLDMDIVNGTKLGDENLKKKVKNILKLQGITNEKAIKQVTEIMKGDTKNYLTDPQEVFARYHSMKMWMLRNGIIKDPHEKITKAHIIKVLLDFDIITGYENNSIDFFELLFYMKMDFDDDANNDKGSLDGFNSMVANYKDFDKTKRDA